MNQEVLVCPICGEEMPSTQRFCGNCGTSLRKNQKKKKKDIAKFFKPTHIVRGVILLVISLVLLVFSFMPMVRYGYDVWDEEGEKAYYTVSTIDAIVYFFEARRNRTDENIEDTYVYREFYAEGERLDKLQENSREANKLVNKIVHYNSRLYLMHVENRPNVSITSAFIISLAYIFTCIIFFAFAAKNVVNLLSRRRALTKPCLRIFFVIPFLAAMLPFVMPGAYGISTPKKETSLYLLLSLIIAVLGIVYFLIVKVTLVREKKSIDKKRFVRHLCAVVLAFSLIIFMLLPVLFVELNMQFKDNKHKKYLIRPVDAEHFQMYDMSGKEIALYSESFSGYENCKTEMMELVEYFKYLTVSDMRKGEGDSVVSALVFEGVITSFWDIGAARVFEYVTVFMLLASVGALLIGVNSLSYIMLDSYNRIVTKIGKILCVVCTLVSVIAIVGICVAAKIGYMATDIDKYAKAFVGIGTILMGMIALILMFVAPNGAESVKKVLTQEN